jgi:pimeloyl-ACP methyl ester carboxylesterase
MPDAPVQEIAVNIGSPIPLVGVITQPPRFDKQSPAVILLNSGVMHHVGTCRLSVTMARLMATQAGLLTLRFDFSGIGDSPSRRSSDSLEQLAVAEIREVMDYLQARYGIARFVLCGLCSGAHNGFVAATREPRVTGLIAYDFHCFPTWRSYLHFYGPKLRRWQTWKSFVQRRFARTDRNEPREQTRQEIADQRFFEQPLFSPRPAKAEIEAGLKALVGRGVDLLLVFTGDHSLDFTYSRQFTDCFSRVDFRDLLQVEYYPQASHIFVEPLYRRKLLDLTARWLQALPRASD